MTGLSGPEFPSAAYILQNRLGLKDETCSFYVTSAEEGEGKSTVAANLAVQLSDMEKKVLLVDLNTRNPRLGSMFYILWITAVH